MPKAYSPDLCERVWSAWQKGGESQRAVAVRFAVSASFLRDLSRRHRTTGSLAPKAHGGGRRPAANQRTVARLEKLVATRNDLTNDEYHRRLTAKGGTLSRATVGRMLLRLRLTRKKRRSKTTKPAANG